MPSPAAPVDEVLTLRETADLLRIDRKLAGRLLRSGAIRGKRVGSQWRVHRKNVIAYLDSELQDQAELSSATKSSGAAPCRTRPLVPAEPRKEEGLT